VLLILEKRKLQGDLLMAFQFTKRIYKRNRERLFIRAYSDRTRYN